LLCIINNHDSFFVDWFSSIYMNMVVDIKATATVATRIVPILVVIVVARADDFVSAPKLTLSPLPCLVGAAAGNELGLVLGKKLGREVGRLVGLVLGNTLGRELGRLVGLELGKKLERELGRLVGLVLGKELGSSPGLEVVPEVRGGKGNWIGAWQIRCTNTIGTKTSGGVTIHGTSTVARSGTIDRGAGIKYIWIYHRLFHCGNDSSTTLRREIFRTTTFGRSVVRVLFM
jgi:tetrahydromethanopterin S-methyltransferase subunit G